MPPLPQTPPHTSVARSQQEPSGGSHGFLSPTAAPAPPSPPRSLPPGAVGVSGEPRSSRKEGRRPCHLQFTLQSTVQSQWQKQKQWKVHSLLTIAARAPWHGREAPVAPRPLTSSPSGSWLVQWVMDTPSSRQMGFATSIFNETSQLTYQNPPVHLIPAIPGSPARLPRPCVGSACGPRGHLGCVRGGPPMLL